MGGGCKAPGAREGSRCLLPRTPEAATGAMRPPKRLSSSEQIAKLQKQLECRLAELQAVKQEQEQLLLRQKVLVSAACSLGSSCSCRRCCCCH